jgi:hypothetical protein
MTTVTWLLALHLTITYVPKVIDAIQGIQQIEQNKQNQQLDEWMIRQFVQNQKVGQSRPTLNHKCTGRAVCHKNT